MHFLQPPFFEYAIILTNMLFLAAIGMVVSPISDSFQGVFPDIPTVLVRSSCASGLHRSDTRLLGIERHLQVPVALRLRVSSGIRWQTLQRVHQPSPGMRDIHAAADDSQ